MKCSFRQGWLRFGFRAVATAALISLSPPPVAANNIPESALLIHVQPVVEGCATLITTCDQINDATSGLGTREFLLFFMPIYWQQMHVPINIRAVDCELTWPESWQFVEGQICDYWGDAFYVSTPPYHFYYDYAPYSWGCPNLPIGNHEVFLVARFVFNVTEPGRLDFTRFENPVSLDCENPFPSYAWSFGAEVASPCEYTHNPCAVPGYCNFDFDPELLVLHAAPGGEADATVEIYTDDCTATEATAMADWLEVELTVNGLWHSRLAVKADASDLAAGNYSTWVRARSDHIARCLPVTFIVGETTPTQPLSWGRIKALYR